MSFTTVFFLFTVLPITWLLFMITPKKWKVNCLCMISFFAYFWAEPIYACLLLLLCIYLYIITSYMLKADEKSRKLLCIELCAIILFLLGYFKYYQFLVQSVGSLVGMDIVLKLFAVPAGISFISFTMISFVIDAYRNQIKEPLRFNVFVLYIFFFPKMIMGPLMRYDAFAKQTSAFTFQVDVLKNGITRLIIGLAKKIILADTFASLFVQISGLGDVPMLNAWLGALAFTFQIYFDFSGYSDMAIGIASLFGFQLPENFQYPYTSISIKQFWKRWHITLSTWFKDYVYIPLGGSRCALPRVIFNTFVVWALTGLWHGASWNFVLWGIYYFVLLMLERYIFDQMLNKIPLVVRKVVTFILVMFGWVLFAFSDFGQLSAYLASLFGANGLINDTSFWFIKNNFIYFLFAFIAMTPIFHQFYEEHKNSHVEIIHDAALLLLFLISIMYLISSTFQPFLYAQF